MNTRILLAVLINGPYIYMDLSKRKLKAYQNVNYFTILDHDCRII